MAIAEVGSGTQRATFRYASADSGTAAFPANVTSGNLLTAQFGGWASPPNTSVAVTDTRSTSYTTLLASVGVVWLGGTGKGAIAYGIAPTSGACTMTIDPNSTGNYFNAVLDEFSGVDSSPLDVDDGETTGTSSTPTASITTVANNDLVLGVMVNDSSTVPILPGVGYTEQDQDITGARQMYSAEFQIVGAAGAKTVDWNTTFNVNWSIYAAAFKETQAAGADTGFSGWPIFRPKLWSY